MTAPAPSSRAVHPSSLPVLRRPAPVREKRRREPRAARGTATSSRRVPRVSPRAAAKATSTRLRAAAPGKPTSTPTWMLRPLRPSDVLVFLVGRMWEGTRDLKEFALAAAVATFVSWLLLSWPPVTMGLVSLATLLGFVLAWKAWAGDARAGLKVGHGLLLTAAASNAGWLTLLVAELPLVASAVAVVFAELFCRLCEPKGVVKVPEWWSAEKISMALVTAGVLKLVRTPDGVEQLPPIHYPPPIGPQHKPTGTWVTFGLPAGSTWQHVVKRHPELASAMGVDPDLLHIERVPGDGSAVRIAVLKPRGKDPIPAVIPTGPVDWTRPIELLDTLGRAVKLLTENVHTTFVGATGSGKTMLARWLVMWAILDPRVPLAVISGKDDEEDWQAMRPLCFRYVGGSKREHVEQAIVLLGELLDLSEQRGGIAKALRIPMVVVVDEWFRLVKAARRYDAAYATRLVADLEELAATCRSRRIHIVTTFQRGTEGYISKDLNGNLVQRCVGLTVAPSEVQYVIGRIPPRLPQDPGDFLVSYEDGEPSLTRVPYLTDEQFVAVCELGLKLRGGIVQPEAVVPTQRAALTDDPSIAQSEPAPVARLHVVSTDPFGDAVRELLRRGELTGTEVHDRLPVELRRANAAMTGKAVAKVHGVVVAWKASTPGGKRNLKAWGLDPAALPTASPSSSSRLHTPAVSSSPRTAGTAAAEHAHTGHSEPLPAAVGAAP